MPHFFHKLPCREWSFEHYHFTETVLRSAYKSKNLQSKKKNMEDELQEGCDVSNDGPLNKSMFDESALHGVVRNFTVGKNPIKLSAEGRTFAHGMRVSLLCVGPTSSGNYTTRAAKEILSCGTLQFMKRRSNLIPKQRFKDVFHCTTRMFPIARNSPIQVTAARGTPCSLHCMCTIKFHLEHHRSKEHHRGNRIQCSLSFCRLGSVRLCFIKTERVYQVVRANFRRKMNDHIKCLRVCWAADRGRYSLSFHSRLLEFSIVLPDDQVTISMTALESVRFTLAIFIAFSRGP